MAELIRPRDFLDGADPADPRKMQHRLGTTPSGRQVWVEITGDDRLAIIKRLHSRWPDVIMARERGESIEEIARKMHIRFPVNEDCQGECDPPCLKDMIAECYTWLEGELHDLAAKRAKLMV